MDKVAIIKSGCDICGCEPWRVEECDNLDCVKEKKPEWGSPEWLEAVGGIEVLKEIVRIHTQE